MDGERGEMDWLVLDFRRFADGLYHFLLCKKGVSQSLAFCPSFLGRLHVRIRRGERRAMMEY